MADMHAKNWDNYWQGRSSKESGNALIEVGIERNHELRDFWLQTFSDVSKSKKIIDFACGAGSVLEHAQALGLTNLTGLDVSEKALEVMSQKIHGCTAICAPVIKTDLSEDTYDMAVSQFGIEYAGDKSHLFQAFTEMYRILKPGGKAVIIAHRLDGIITEGCQASLEQINLIEDCGFIDAAQNVVSALHEPSRHVNEASSKLQHKLNGAAEPIMSWLKSFEDLEAEKTKNQFTKFVYHLLESSHRLITHHKNYSLKDSLSWFQGIRLELEAYKGRMLSMTEAALSLQDISELQEKLKSQRNTSKFNFEETGSLHFNGNSKPAAWIIRAQKL